MSQLHTTYRYAILGKPGTGKTTLARALIEEEILTQDWIKGIWSNTPIYAPHNNHPYNLGHNGDCPLHPLYHQVTYGRQYERARNGVCLLDEISKIFPSRNVGHSKTQQWELIQQVVTNMRRHNNYMLYTDQWRRGADILIRTTVDRLFMPTVTKTDINHSHGNVPLGYLTIQPKSTEFFEMENPELWTYDHTKMMLKDIFMLFATKEQVEMTYNPPFNIERWTKAFLLWTAKHNYNIQNEKAGTVRNILDLYQIKKKQYIASKELSAVLGKLKVDGHI